MVGDNCHPDWLSEKLAQDDASVLVLDCRAPGDYRTSHIIGSVHITVPTLMMRRLGKGNLPVESVINCHDGLSKEWKSETIILLDERTVDICRSSENLFNTGAILPDTSSDVMTRCCDAESTSCVGYSDATLRSCDVAVTSQRDSCCRRLSQQTDVSTRQVMGLLLRRLKEEGCDVRWLEGGFTAFSSKYPHLCVTSSSADPASESSILGLRYLHLSSSSSSSSSASSSTGATGHPSGLEDDGIGTEEEEGGLGDAEPASPDGSTPFPVEVLPYLFLGDARNSADLDFLYKNDIKYILNVTKNVPNKFEKTEPFRYMQIPISDHWSQNLTRYFPDAIAFIDEGRRKKCGVLVHCLAGISRSVTITVAYLMHSLSLSLNDAYDQVKRCKPNISPNFNFMGQLLDYESTLRLERLYATSSCSCGRLPVHHPPQQGLSASSHHDTITVTLSSSSDGPPVVSASLIPCVCHLVDSRSYFSSPASSLSSLSSTAATSSSSSATSSSAFDYELPSGHS